VHGDPEQIHPSEQKLDTHEHISGVVVTDGVTDGVIDTVGAGDGHDPSIQ